MRGIITSTIDPNTNETVKKCALPEDFNKEMNKVLGMHQERLNQFMILSQQCSDIQTKWLDMRKQITATDEDFKKKMKYVAKKLKLVETDPWTYNIQEQCFEMREPPEIQPLTSGQFKEANNGIV